MGFEQQVDQWREFYLAVAGAAAVLPGLVFVALSLHLEQAQAPGIPVLGLGSQALINLTYVLLVSLGMLAPYRPPVLPGIAVLAVAAVGLSDSVTTLRRARRARQPRLTIMSDPLRIGLSCTRRSRHRRATKPHFHAPGWATSP
jgi:hypothetical protein